VVAAPIMCVMTSKLRATPEQTGGGRSVVGDVRPGRHLGWFRRRNRAKDLLRLVDLTPEDLWRLRRLTFEFRSDPRRHYRALRDGTALSWFTTWSAGKADSVAVASERLGASLAVDPHKLWPGRVGSLENAGRVLSSLGRVIVVGGLEDRDLGRLATAASVPVINAFSDGHDPCEALAELVSLEAHFGTLKGYRLAYLGQACNVTHDLMAAAALIGITLTIPTPEGCQPNPLITLQAGNLAERHGGNLRLTRHPGRAVERADGILLGPLPPSWRHLRPEVVDGASPDVALLSCSPTSCLPSRNPNRAESNRATRRFMRPRPLLSVASLSSATTSNPRNAGGCWPPSR
jgi:ornithine carbamoyltransferase